MNFATTEDQRIIDASVSSFLRDQYDFDTRRKHAKAPLPDDRLFWGKFAELGLLSLPFSTELDGMGGNMTDIAVIMQNIGKSLVLEPYLETVVIAGHILDACNASLIPQIMEGAVTVSLAANNIIHSQSADYIIVQEGAGLFLLPAREVTLAPFKLMDGSVSADISFTIDEKHRLGDAALLDTAIQKGRVALCAEAAAIMGALCDITREYLNSREQFGAKLGSFQALQHRFADMCTAAEEAFAITRMACEAFDNDIVEQYQRLSLAAAVIIGKNGRLIGHEAIQMHGAMGVTDELIVSHYNRRLMVIRHRLGANELMLGQHLLKGA